MEIYKEKEDTRVRQSFDHPAVYFDHWAIRRFCDCGELQDRLVDVLQDKRGTFVVSHVNLTEFGGPSDPRHSAEAEQFLDRLLPNVFLAYFNPEKALNLVSFPEQRILPLADLDMLKLLAEQCISAGTDLSFAGFIAQAHTHRDRINAVEARATDNIIAMLKAQRRDQSYVKKALKSVPDTKRSKAAIVMGELMRDWILDPVADITPNDVVDWQHAIASVISCDYVLLDGKWEQRVQRIVERADKQGINLNLAKCFSKRDNGLDRFLSDIEKY